MSSEIDVQKLAQAIRSKRGKRGLREIAAEIGEVSASTLSRVEKGNIPDLDTFVRICGWLEVPMETFIIKGGQTSIEETSQPKVEEDVNSRTLTVHLRADRVLDPKTAKALKALIQLAYEAVERGDFDDEE